jgi:hypothetical protein
VRDVLGDPKKRREKWLGFATIVPTSSWLTLYFLKQIVRGDFGSFDHIWLLAQKVANWGFEDLRKRDLRQNGFCGLYQDFDEGVVC